MKKNILEYDVNEKIELLKFLYKVVNNSKNNIKTFLKNGNVSVNDKVITKHNYLLNISDKVVIKLFSTNLYRHLLVQSDLLYKKLHQMQEIILHSPLPLVALSFSVLLRSWCYQ